MPRGRPAQRGGRLMSDGSVGRWSEQLRERVGVPEAEVSRRPRPRSGELPDPQRINVSGDIVCVADPSVVADAAQDKRTD